MLGLTIKKRSITYKNGREYNVFYYGCDSTTRNCVYAIVLDNCFVKIGHIFHEDLGERVNRYLKSDKDKTVMKHAKNHGEVCVLKLNEYHHDKTCETNPEDFLFILEQIAIRDYAYELIKKKYPNSGKLIDKNEYVLDWVKRKNLTHEFGNKRLDRKQMLIDYQLGMYPDVDDFLLVSPNRIDLLVGFTEEYNQYVG